MDLQLGEVRLEDGLFEPRIDPHTLADAEELPETDHPDGSYRDGRGEISAELAELASQYGHEVKPD